MRVIAASEEQHGAPAHAVDSLHQAVEDVLAHATERGDLPPRPAAPSGDHSLEVSAVVALVLHWQSLRGQPITDGDIGAIVDRILTPLIQSRSSG
ncbi:hypothetical protein ABZ614_06445 [Streptomyces sp. NPDC013178]|uniref:hypothetical protein n=1 Tax=Streptomyces sp. NPDC013178 TaxID=3155118 RepID=UPI0033E9724B